MKDRRTYLNEILEVLNRIDDLWILEQVLKFVKGMIRGTRYER